MLIKVLISSLALPPTNFGSWTNRITNFQKRKGYFDYILSPTQSPDKTYIFCQKDKLKIWDKAFQGRAQKVAKNYLDFISSLIIKGKPIQLLVVDDRNLLEAVIGIKSLLPSGSEIIYSHHGHNLSIPNWVMDLVDKVFFLTLEGYQKTLEYNYQFTPEVFIVGNGVVGDEFKPISKEEKDKRKVELGFEMNDLVILWLANSRPVKGLHLFEKVIHQLLKKYPEIKILSLGHDPLQSVPQKSWKQIGKVPNEKLPYFLQVGEVYFFTSLWQEGFGLSLAEAVKCGNWAIASNLGGIPKVLSDVPNSILIQNPNIVEEWVDAFEKFLLLRKEGKPSLSAAQLKEWNTYEDWESRYLKALES